MRKLEFGKIAELLAINTLARSAKKYNLSNAVFLVLLREAIAHKNEWEITWISDPNDNYFDLLLIKMMPSNIYIVLPTPILKPEMRRYIFDALLRENAVRIKNADKKLVFQPLQETGVDVLWKMFFSNHTTRRSCCASTTQFR